MRAILWGLLLLGLALAGLMPPGEFTGQLGLNMAPAEFERYRTYALIALSVVVLLEGIAALFRKPSVVVGTSQLDEAVAERDAARAELEQLQQKNDELMTTVKETEARFVQLEQEKATAAASKGDQEVTNFVSLLQSKGRFIDFVMDDIAKYPDAQIGAAARVVHQGCSQVIRDYFEIKPVAENAEGSTLTLEEGYDTHQFKLLGHVRGEPPFRGRVLHRGWRTEKVRLPEATVRPDTAQKVIAPAEVELH